jgi:hypothetical protein
MAAEAEATAILECAIKKDSEKESQLHLEHALAETEHPKGNMPVPLRAM